jgi:hypothetical protein
MKLWIHTYLCTATLWLGAFDSSNDIEAKDVISDSGISFARLKTLCVSTADAYLLPKEIVRKLYLNERDEVYELKQNSIRLTFLQDENLFYGKIIIPKIIVCLSYFIKKRNKTDKNEIVRAVTLKNSYLKAKQDGSLEIAELREIKNG